MELRLPLEVSPGREATCRAVFGTWGFFPDDARAGHCPFVLTSFTGWSSERCPGIGFLPRGDREIGVLRNVEPPTRPRCKRLQGQPDEAEQLQRVAVEVVDRQANALQQLRPRRWRFGSGLATIFDQRGADCFQQGATRR